MATWKWKRTKQEEETNAATKATWKMPSATMKRSTSLASLVDAVDRTHLRASGNGTEGSPTRNKLAKSNSAANLQRTRPTNNQLLYKAYFRWEHFPHPLGEGWGLEDLPEETEACASVTSAFLQILSALHEIEQRRKDGPVNVLKLLSTNTRRTKVVELNTGTHRVPEELRKHCLVDEDNSQYSTNLDRNRYGSDDQYLATVVRFDLDFIGLCPCLVDIEIIDAKSGNESLMIAATNEECNCHSPPRSPNLAQALASSCVQKVAVKPVLQKSSSSVDIKTTDGGMKKSKSGLDMLFLAALDATKPEEKGEDNAALDREIRKRRKHNEETCGCIICQQKRRARTQGRFPTLKAFKRINSAPALHVDKEGQVARVRTPSPGPKILEHEEEDEKEEFTSSKVKRSGTTSVPPTPQASGPDMSNSLKSLPTMQFLPYGIPSGVQSMVGSTKEGSAKHYPQLNGHGSAHLNTENICRDLDMMKGQMSAAKREVEGLLQEIASSSGREVHTDRLMKVREALAAADNIYIDTASLRAQLDGAKVFSALGGDANAIYGQIAELGRRLAEADSVIAAVRLREMELLRALHAGEERARVAELETTHLRQLLSTASKQKEGNFANDEDKILKLESELARLRAQNSRFEENERIAGMRMSQMLEALNATQHAAATAQAQLLSEQQGKEAYVHQLQRLAKEVTEAKKRAEVAESELSKIGQPVPESRTQ